jgi:hypothetical protein
MLKYFNEHAGAIGALVALITVVLTAVITITTIVYARLTHLMLSEARRAREAQTEPQLAVYAEDSVSIHFKDFVIRNIGAAPAYKIRFKVLEDFVYDKEQRFSTLPFVMNGIRYLAPNQKFSFFFTNLLEEFDRKVAAPLKVHVSFENREGRQYDEVFTIDFAEAKDLTHLERKNLETVARQLESISRDIGHFCSGYRKLHVILEKPAALRGVKLRRPIEAAVREEIAPAISDDQLGSGSGGETNLEEESMPKVDK